MSDESNKLKINRINFIEGSMKSDGGY